MAVDPTDGEIDIVWYDDRDDPNRTDGTPLVNLYFASSTDSGLSFSRNLRVSTQSSNTTADFGAGANAFFGDYNGIAARGGVAFPFWTDSRTGSQDVMITQVGGADLKITKADHPDPATAGGHLFYDITVTNDGPAAAFNVKVVDVLPTGVTFQASTLPCTLTTAPSTYTCDVGSLGIGESKTFTIDVLVSASAGGATTLTNTATVQSDQDDPNTSNNTATATTILQELADLAVSKTCKPDSPAPTGSTATCAITVENLGPSDARNVVLTDTILSNGTFTITAVTVAPLTSGTCTFPSGPQTGTATITCDLGVEPAGGTTTITVSFTSSSAVDVNDTATVRSDTPDPNTANNTATGKVSFIGSVDLAITKTDAPDPVVAGTNVTYTITVSNLSATAAPNVVMKDVLPKEVSLVSATTSQGTCSGTTVPGDPLQPLTCNLSTVSNGTPVTITVVAQVSASTPNGTVLVNNATVSSDFGDANNGNNNVTSSTNVITRADLAIAKTSDAPTYKPSSIITFTVQVTNNGASDAQAVVVRDTLPDTRQAQYLSDTGGCRLQGNQLLCELGTLKVGESKSFDIKITVRGSRGDVTNTASVSSATTDPATGNNTVTKTVTVQGGG
jgi:uncharacterized repeat protein (TIGR01451 family)